MRGWWGNLREFIYQTKIDRQPLRRTVAILVRSVNHLVYRAIVTDVAERSLYKKLGMSIGTSNKLANLFACLTVGCLITEAKRLNN